MTKTFENWKQKLRLSLLYTFVWGLIAHGYCFFNLNLSHDSLILFQDQDIPAMLSVGRFMQPVYFWFRGNTYPPALVGFLSLVFIGLSVYLMAQLLDVENRGSLVLLSGILSVNAVVALTNASYIHDSDLYALALLLATCAVTVGRKGKWGFVAAIPLAVMSMGFYQSYIQVTLMLHLMLAVLALLKKETAKKVFAQGMKAVVTLAVSLILYYGLYQFFLTATGTGASVNYNTLSEASSFGGFGDMVNNAATTVLNTIRYFCRPAIYHPQLMAAVNGIIALLTLGLVVSLLLRQKIRGWELVLLVALFAVLPFGINLICFISKGMVHHIMYYSFFLVYVLGERIFALWLETGGQEQIRNATVRHAAPWIMPGLIALMLGNSVIYANQIYLKKAVEYDATQITMTRILDRMEQTEGYVYGETPVAFVGMLLDSKMTTQSPDFDYSGAGLWHSFAVTFPGSYGFYLNNILNYAAPLVSESDCDTLAQTPAVQSMGYFPAKNSIQMVDGILVVKLSEIVDHST